MRDVSLVPQQTAQPRWRLALQRSDVESVPVLLTLVGFALYLVVRVGQQAYAGQLGLPPEDLGLSYSSSIAGAAALTGALAVMLFVTAVWLLAGIILIQRVFAKTARLSRRYRHAIRGIHAFGVLFVEGLVLAIIVSLFFMAVFPHVAPFDYFVAAILPSFFLLWLLPLTVERPFSLRTLKFLHRARIPVLAAVTLLGLLFVAADEGSSAAHHIEDGEPTHVPFYGIRAEEVTVTGSLPHGFTPPARVMLLASTENRLTLYDLDRCRFILLPAEGALVVQENRPPAQTGPCRRPQRQTT